MRVSACREIGRIERTLFMLDWFRDPALRRRVQAGLNKGEARNALARAVFMHRLGEIRDRKPENQSYRASGLTLLTAAISLWNTGFRVSRPASYPDGPLLRTGLAELPHPAPDRSVSPHIFSESVTILIWFSIYPDNPAFSGSDSAFSMSSDDDLLYG